MTTQPSAGPVEDPRIQTMIVLLPYEMDNKRPDQRVEIAKKKLAALDAADAAAGVMRVYNQNQSGDSVTNYIMVIRDDSYHMIGPFSDNDAAATWARANNPTDDPRWQTLRLENPQGAPQLVDPEVAGLYDDPISLSTRAAIAKVRGSENA